MVEYIKVIKVNVKINIKMFDGDKSPNELFSTTRQNKTKTCI